MKKIIFYGKPGCSDCVRSKIFLDQQNISYKYINIEDEPQAVEEVEKLTNGLKKVPTILFPNGKVLIEPLNKELQLALQELQV